MSIFSAQVLVNAVLGVALFLAFRKLKGRRVRDSMYGDINGPPRLRGSLHQVLNDGLDYILQNFDRYGGVFKFIGPYRKQTLLVSDPLAVQHIMAKDHDSFQPTEDFLNGSFLVFGEGLLSTTAGQHKHQRRLLLSAFSTANMQDMLPALQPIANKLLSGIVAGIRPNETAEIDTLKWAVRTSIEYIGQAGMGHSFDSLNPNNRSASEYIVAVRKIVPLSQKLRYLRGAVPYVVRHLSSFWRNRLVDWLPISALKEMRQSASMIYDNSRKILAERKADLEHERHASIRERYDEEDDSEIKGKDVISILLRANDSAPEGQKLTEEEILGQMGVFMFAGFETTSIALCRMLYILAQDSCIQARLRSEIRKAKQEYATFQAEIEMEDEETPWQDVVLPYDILMGLPYLDALLKETLRVYPPVSELGRVAHKTTSIPLHTPIRSRSGVPMNTITIPQGAYVGVSILGCNYNKEVWGEDAHEFRPERWLVAMSGSKVRKASMAGTMRDSDLEERMSPELCDLPEDTGKVKYPGVYSWMMTFGGGERGCIGYRFSEMEIKQVLATLLPTLHFSLPKTKEIHWHFDGFQMPVVRSPTGGDTTRQVPLNVRLVHAKDFAPDPHS